MNSFLTWKIYLYGLARPLHRLRVNEEWIVETPQGPAKISMAEKNRFGVLDHFVKTSVGVEVFVPMRVVQNGQGSEVIFTLFQTADMSDEMFAQDLKMVEQDLNRLKSIVERNGKQSQ